MTRRKASHSRNAMNPLPSLAPRVVTRREVIKDVPAQWRAQYPDDDGNFGPRNRQVREKLEALDLETATVAQVGEAIGNESWTRLECAICEQDRDAVVSIPREFDSSIRVCGECAEGIAAMLRDAQP